MAGEIARKYTKLLTCSLKKLQNFATNGNQLPNN